MFYITQNLELYIKWKLMKFLTTYVHDVYHQSVVLKVLAISFHNWYTFIFRSKFPTVRSERQVPDRSGTIQIAGFHVPDRSRK